MKVGLLVSPASLLTIMNSLAWRRITQWTGFSAVLSRLHCELLGGIRL